MCFFHSFVWLLFFSFFAGVFLCAVSFGIYHKIMRKFILLTDLNFEVKFKVLEKINNTIFDSKLIPLISLTHIQVTNLVQSCAFSKGSFIFLVATITTNGKILTSLFLLCLTEKQNPTRFIQDTNSIFNFCVSVS